VFFRLVADAYSQKMNLEASLGLAEDDIKRLRSNLSSYDGRIRAQQKIIQDAEGRKKTILKELSQKLETIPFYTVYFGASEYETRGRSPKDVDL